ncbi:zf-HC2 domain-containing protein [Propionicicella superfundia]|uniref:zf-HC2 domain-containing protein n=1 Tax=Propionicicella superfundia TaxID=348582 RepID=UPI00040E3CED|nr:zf-HC2 domain-containing protein [Propionicicella superfundia]
MIGGLRYGCRELSPRYSQYVDDDAGPLLTDVIERHLLTCESCTAEVVALRRVRDRLNATGEPGTADGGLTTRLVSIAGPEASRPLALRAGQGPLPTRAQARRRLVAAGVLFTLTAILAWGGIGLTAAPTLLGAEDLADEDRTEFTTVLNSTPLEMPVVVALLAVGPDTVGQPTSAATAAVFRRDTPLAQPAAALTRAVAQQVQSHGTARVTLRTADGYRTATATVAVGAGAATVEVFDAAGDVAHHGYLPRGSVDLPDWLAGSYTLSGWSGAAEVAGRVATVVEASLPNRVVARWWLDEATGTVLWLERYAPDGAVTLSAGYTDFFPTAVADGSVSSSLLRQGDDTIMSEDQQCPKGWTCADTVHGLPLVGRVADRLEDPTSIQSVYSDGVTTVSVRQRRGTLSGIPDGFTRSADSLVADGLPATVMWQSGASVYTVTTNDCLTVAREVAAALPHDQGFGTDLLSRVVAGWADIVERM